MVKYILISGTLLIAFILGGLKLVDYQLGVVPSICAQKVTESAYVAEIANVTGRVPIAMQQDGSLADISQHSDTKFTVRGDVCA